MKRIVILILSLFLLSLTTQAEEQNRFLRISQIDTNQLLASQEVRLYLSLTDAKGDPIKDAQATDFKLFESADNNRYFSAGPITQFRTGVNYEKGIRFLLLIDNSGSMYRTMEGFDTTDTAKQRITIAKGAIKSFVNSVTNPKDKIGVASYNSFYNPLLPPTENKAEVLKLLDKIEKPKGDQVYTEIYGSLLQALEDFRTERGRKAVIILSDGENSPYIQSVKKPHPVYGEQIIGYEEPLEAIQAEGISVYSIHFGKRGQKKDANLSHISRLSGGAVFDAHNKDELSSVYFEIMDQVLNEYELTYRATMTPSPKKWVTAVFENSDQKADANRYYFSSTLMGKPIEPFPWWILAAFPIAVLGVWGLSRMKFERRLKQPGIEVMDTGGAGVSTQVLNLDGDKTVIGASVSADMTIAGLPEVNEVQATIIADAKGGYTIVSDATVMVNNQQVKKKSLESGDLINVGGVTMVFDDGKTE